MWVELQSNNLHLFFRPVRSSTLGVILTVAISLFPEYLRTIQPKAIGNNFTRWNYWVDLRRMCPVTYLQDQKAAVSAVRALSEKAMAAAESACARVMEGESSLECAEAKLGVRLGDIIRTQVNQAYGTGHRTQSFLVRTKVNHTRYVIRSEEPQPESIFLGHRKHSNTGKHGD